jgi:histidinol dehydrogenase
VYLKVIKGLEQAKGAIPRVDPLDFGDLPPEVTERTKQIFGAPLSPLESVQRILRDVQQQGDIAVRRYSHLLDNVEVGDLQVSEETIGQAGEKVSATLKESLGLAAKRVEDFHRATMRKSWVDLSSGLGELVTPIERVGIYIPGGTAAYPSTVMMTAIPARVAGVKEIVLCSPPRDGDAPDPAVLAAAKLAGVDQVFRVGGVQAIGAMAFGTESIPKVDKICGPGNIFVTLAKKHVFGQVDIDGLYGPTETIVIADDSASPVYCAADLLAQAEHDPLASPILVTTSPSLVSEVEEELDRQIGSLERGGMAGMSLEGRGMAILVDNLDEALELANGFAPEHLCMMVEEPWAWAGKVKHAGGVFLGPYSPEVVGDYIAGPSHVMPTGGTARFNSALSVHHFLKTMPVVGLKPEEYPKLAEAASTIARAEGLTGHARALEVRLKDLKGTSPST